MNLKLPLLATTLALALAGCAADVTSQGANPPAAESSESSPATKDVFSIGETIKIDETLMIVNSAKSGPPPTSTRALTREPYTS